MRTFQLRLIGESDGIVYGIKEYEAASEAQAAEVASGLCGDESDLWPFRSFPPPPATGAPALSDR